MAQASDVIITVDTGEIAYIGTVPSVVITLPSITLQPVSASVTAPANYTFTSGAENYQLINWQRTSPPGATFSDIVGATSLSYNTGPTSNPADNGAKFRLRASNVVGTVYSNDATLSVAPAIVEQLTLDVPPTGVISIATTCYVVNSGNVDQSWTLSASPTATITPSSGTTVAGGSTAFTITSAAAGGYSVTLTNTSGGSVVGSPDSISIYDPAGGPMSGYIARNADALLFQPIDTKYRTVTLTSPHPYPGTYQYNFDGETNYSAFGPTWLQVSRFNNWTWANAGGDWIDSTLTAQGASHWHQSASGNSITPGNNTWYATPITEVTQYAQTNDKWLALIAIAGIGGGGPRTIAGRHTATPPRVEVTYADTTTATLACKTVALISSPSTIPSTFGDGSGNVAISTARALLEFERPTKEVASATLHYYVTQHFGAAPGLAFSLVNPPTANTTAGTGVAMSAGTWDEGIDAITGMLGSQRLVDTGVESDYISTININQANSELSPEFWGGSVNTAKMPYASYHPISGKPRWVNAKATGGYGELNFVPSTYTGEGFVPLQPGLAAIKITIPGNPAVDAADGYQGNPYGSTGSIARLFGIPADRMGLIRRVLSRWYVRLHIPRPLVSSDRRVYFEGGSSSSFSALAGKCGFAVTHDCTQGGVSASSGSGWGWQMRMQYKMALPGNAGPDAGKWSPGIHIKSDYYYKSLDGYEYATGAYLEQFGKVGGYGGAMPFDDWVLFETDIKQNTVTTSGLGYVPDGHVKVWINGRLVMDDTDMAFVSLPLNPGVGPAVITAGGSNVGNGTCVSNAVVSGGRDQSYKCFPETLTLAFTSATDYTITGSFRGSYGTGTVGTMYATNRHRFTVTAGGTPFEAGDTFTIVYPPYVTDIPNSTLQTPMRELGIREFWLNHFHGGRNECGLDITWFYTGFAWADGDVVPYIGPMKGLDGSPILPDA